MTHEAKSSDTVQHPMLSPSRPVRLERLEYGKFCETTEGRIENKAEHRLLGWSADFPRELIELCSPSRLGIGSDAFCFEDLSPSAPRHGTILRPVVVEGASPARVMSLFCRVRTRPEDGEEGQGRRYTAARYLVDASCRVSPLALLGAMNDPPLSGVTRADVAPSLSPLSAHATPEAELDEEAQRFLRGSVEYVMSGIPVCVAEMVEELTFFKWVTALWHALPWSLRPYLSAGWGVGGQLSGKLTVTLATRRAETCPVFYRRQREWAAPPVVTVWDGGARKKPFFKGRLQPGHKYARHAFGRSPEGRLAVDAFKLYGEDFYLAEALGEVRRSTLADMLNPALVRAFRLPGLRLGAARRLREVIGWVDEGGAVDRETMPDLKGLVYEDNFLKAFNHSVEALAQAESRARADEVMWGCLREGTRIPYEQALIESSAPWVARARLLSALSGGSVAKVMGTLGLAAKARQAEGLRPEASAALHQALNMDVSFSAAENRRAHARIILARESPPVAYCDWLKSGLGARSNGFRLSLAFLRRDPHDRSLAPEAADICDHIAHDAKLPAVASLRNWARGFSLMDDDRKALSALDVADKSEFAALLAADWDVPVSNLRARRKALLAWLGVTGSVETSSPLLRLFFNLQLSISDVSVIAAEIESEQVPDELLEDVASVTLQCWHLLGERVEQGAPQWEPVLDVWHDDLRTALMLAPRRKGAPPSRMDAETCAKRTRMSPAQLETLIKRWCTKEYRNSLPSVAWMFWLWAAQAATSGLLKPNVTDLCRQLNDLSSQRNGLCLVNNLAPAEDDLRDAAHLARAARAHKLLADKALPLWSVTRISWQIRFLLDVFADADLRPTVEQLVKLVPHREWLKRHLKRKHVHEHRKKWYQLATLSFHRVVYPGSNKVSWDENYCGGSALWAAFKGVPFELQGNLKEALAQYGADAAERSELCLLYLKAYFHRPSDYQKAVERVLKSHLVPLLQDYYDPDKVARVLELQQGNGHAISITIPKYLNLLDEKSLNLLNEVVQKSERKVRESALKHVLRRSER